MTVSVGAWWLLFSELLECDGREHTSSPSSGLVSQTPISRPRENDGIGPVFHLEGDPMETLRRLHVRYKRNEIAIVNIACQAH